MARVTKSVTAKAKHKKVLKSTKGHLNGVDYIKQLNNLISSPFSMLLETGKVKESF